MVIQRGEKMDGKLEEEILCDGKDPNLTVEGMMAKVHSVLHPVDKTIEYPGVGKSISYGTSISPQSSSTGVSATEIENLAERVEKRGNQWCVVHCHGANAGEPIKCFDNEEDALAMHNAMQANTAETVLKTMKATTENLTRLEPETKRLLDHYNVAADTLNKWTATKNEELKLKMAEVQTAKEEIQVAQEAVQVKIEKLKARETEVEAKQNEIQLQIADMQGLIVKGLAEVATLRESIPERKQLLALAETQQILYENARDKLHGSFKGRQTQIERQSTTYEDPMKQMRESLKGK